MKTFLMLAGAAALGIAAPALAGPGKGHGPKHKGGAHAMSHGGQYNGYSCPPGLAKKSPACVPPGQAKKLYNVGQRYPYAQQSLFGYNQLPYDYRQRYAYDPYARYGYDNGTYYQVDPTTMVVRSILGALIR